jgi:hypothetical protein
MSKVSDFLNPPDQPGCEKIYGRYGCKQCDEDMEFAWWDRNKQMFFWVCSKNHRTEQPLV